MKININEKKGSITMICGEKFVTLFHDFDCAQGVDFETWKNEVESKTEEEFEVRWQESWRNRNKCYMPSEYKYVGFMSDLEKDFPDYLNAMFISPEGEII